MRHRGSVGNPVIKEEIVLGNAISTTNGEIGISFEGTLHGKYSDAKAVIKAYEQEGTSFLEKLDGSFAFCLWDNRKKVLFVARDRFGIKPLFYLKINGALVFASEIKQLFKSAKPEIRMIKSNWMFVPNFFSLRIFEQKTLGSWYLRVMHGLAFLGLCAPLTFVESADKLYIASSHIAGVNVPCGSHPDIDNNVRWTGTSVEHDGYELSRQEKVFLIADYIRKNEPGLQIIACNDFNSRSRVGIGRNCNRCEKCYRTILGLEIAGIDPNKHGFSVNGETFLQMRKKIETRAWHFGFDEVYMWSDLQKHGNNARLVPHQEAQVFLDWFRKINVDCLSSKVTTIMLIDQRLMRFPYPVLKLIEKLYYLLVARVKIFR